MIHILEVAKEFISIGVGAIVGTAINIILSFWKHN